MTTFHMPSEVFYRVSQKFGFVIQKRPVNRRNMTPVEKDARSYSKSQCGISVAGYWTKNKIGYFPEMRDAYRLIRNDELLAYPSLKPIKNGGKEEEVEIDPTDFAICQLRAQGETWDSVAAKVGMSKGGVIGRGSRLGLLKEENS